MKLKEYFEILSLTLIEYYGISVLIVNIFFFMLFLTALINQAQFNFIIDAIPNILGQIIAWYFAISLIIYPYFVLKNYRS